MELCYPCTLPPLPYPYNALCPTISSETLCFHHDRHFQTYVDNLNTALSDAPELQNRSLEELLRYPETLPASKRTAIRNNGGGVYNHWLYFCGMSPKGGGQPDGPLAAALETAFGSFAQWRAQMRAAALEQFGSGYAWLVCEASGGVSITKTANQDTPLSMGQYPLLCVDVWEHAYYLDHRNRRADYVDGWFDLIDWSFVQKRYEMGCGH